MSFNLLDLVKDQVTGSLAKEASSFLGENSSSVTKALDGIFPSLLGGAIDMGSSNKGAEGLLGLIKGVDSSMLGNIGNIFGGGASSVNGLLNSGGGIVDMIFGNKIGGIISLISKMSGLKDSSAGSLIKMAAPFLMGMIGKKMTGGGVSGLMDLLMGQKNHVAKAMPSGMGNLLGLSALGDMGKSAFSAAKDGVERTADAVGDAGRNVANTAGNVGRAAVNTTTEAASTGMSWLKWLLPLLLLAAALYFFLGKGCASDVVDGAKDATSTVVEGAKDAGSAVAGAAGDAANAVGDAAGAAAGAVGDAAGAVGDFAKAAFGKVDAAAKAALDKITFAAGSAGEQMMTYIKGDFKGNGTFRFKNLNFATGSAKIDGKSGVEVDNLAAILKAYPGVNVEINGYTDNTGNAAANVELSKARAQAVVARLLAQGIPASRMSANGYGSANPVGDNGTDAGRAMNRRIEVQLVK